MWKKQTKKFLLICAAPLLKGLLKLLRYSCTIHIEGRETFRQTADSSPCIVMFWHNQIAMIPELFKMFASDYRYAALISNSRDGEWLARLTESYPQARSIRVPHNKRSQALQTAIKNLRRGQEVLLITPDGPRGPLYRVKPGIALAARKASAMVIPVAWQATRFWQLKTWDQFIIPKPFSKIYLKIGDPICLKEERENKRSLEEETLLLEQALMQLKD